MVLQKNIVKEKLLINGNWIETEDTHKVYNKYTGELFSEIALADEKTVDFAIESAVRAHKEVDFPVEQRYKVLMHTAKLLKEHEDEIAEMIAIEGGKPITDARVEVGRSVSTLELAAIESKKLVGEMIPNHSTPGRFLYTIKKPVGVVAAITPFNFPLNLVVHKVGPALAAGNPIIIKPASDTATTTVKFMRVVRRGRCT